ncbi:MAG TPA: N-6 DNA methylase, partial [Bellilinea sp.]|nr:N-6 DNA methylase [Bellilinea sp.]
EEKLKGWLDEIRVTDPDERPGLQRTVDEELLKFVEKQVLTFTVCDPAMGSGHFLVNAAHHIANFIVETLNLSEGENQSLDIEPGYWRRRAVERGIYGVDVSEMAVELAKLSLWLATMAQGKPLSFLKHRLRQGNSLIGARMEEIKVALAESTAHKKPSRKEQELRKTGQLSMLEHPAFSHHMQAATSLLERISGRIAQTLEDVKAQEADYDQAQIELAPLKKLADLLVAQYFGLSVEKDKFISAAKYI